MKEHEEHIIDERIAKYLAGEASPDEAIWLDEWKGSSEENLRYFNRAKQVFGFTLDQTVNTAAMYSRITAQQPKQARRITLASYFTPVRIAASLIILPLLGILIYLMIQNRQVSPDMVLASSDQIIEQTLSDGSSIALNKHATLTILGSFNKKERKVKLEGEAFFEVIHDEEKPFVIEAGGVTIQDIGTSFNVDANPESDSVLVFVTEGVVELSSPDQSLLLRKDQSAVYIKSVRQMHLVTKPLNNVGAFKTKHFRFQANTLSEVVRTLNAVYGNVIQLENEQIGTCTISVEFHDESLEMILAIISETLGLRVEQRRDTYILKGKSCTP